MTKNKIGQASTETIWKSRWMQAFDNMKNNNSFVLKNGYPTRAQEAYSKPPSYREHYSDLDDRYQKRKPVVIPRKPDQLEDDTQSLTSNKTMKNVGLCLKITNIVIGILITLSLILSVVGTATPYWFDTGTLHLGLFQVCTQTSTCDSASTFTDSASADTSNTWLIVNILDFTSNTTIYLFLASNPASNTWLIVKILDLSGCSVLFLSIIFYCIYVHCTTVDYRKASCGVFLSLFVMIGAGAILSGMAVMIKYYFDIGQAYTFDWSFYVAASGGGLAFITFSIMLVYVFALAFE